MTLEEILNYRRSIKHYKNLPIDSEKVKHCIELATLAPNSNNANFIFPLFRNFRDCPKNQSVHYWDFQNNHLSGI